MSCLKLCSVVCAILINSFGYAQNELQTESMRWPVGTEQQDISSFLDIYRDFRSYNQLLLIHNFSKNDVLLQESDLRKKDKISTWVIPREKIALLFIRQDPVSLICVEKFTTGEQITSCKNVIKAGLLPDTMVFKSKKNWIGNFRTIFDVDLALRALGVHIIV